MKKCPRSGAKFLWQGQVVTAVPAGFVRGHRSNVTCFKEGGETLAVVRMGAGHSRYYPPLKELKPLPEQLRVPPLMHVDRWRTESYGFSQPVAPGVNGITEADEAATSRSVALSNFRAKVHEYLRGEETQGVVQMYENAARGAGVDEKTIEAVWHIEQLHRGGVGGIEETDTLRLYGSCVKKCRRHAPHSLGPCIDKCQEKGGQVGALFDRATNAFGPIDPKVRARLQRYLANPSERNWDDVHSTIVNQRGSVTVWQAVLAVDPTFLRVGPSSPMHGPRGKWSRWPDKWTFAKAIAYATGTRAPHSGGDAQVLQLRGGGGHVNGVPRNWEKKIADVAAGSLSADRTFVVVVVASAETYVAGGPYASMQVALQQKTRLDNRDGSNTYVVARYGRKVVVYSGPDTVLYSGSLGGTEDFHARNAQIWAGHAVDEAEQGAADALDRGQCGRALASLVRAERKTTMASTHATQVADERLRVKARASNDLVNALWREFGKKCVRGADLPGSSSPFGGLGGVPRNWEKKIADVAAGSLSTDRTFVVVVVASAETYVAGGPYDSMQVAFQQKTRLDNRDGSNTYVVARYGRKVVVYSGPDTILYSGALGGLGETRYTLPDVE